jgi:hypothetical protein
LAAQLDDAHADALILAAQLDDAQTTIDIATVDVAKARKEATDAQADTLYYAKITNIVDAAADAEANAAMSALSANEQITMARDEAAFYSYAAFDLSNKLDEAYEKVRDSVFRYVASS